MGGRVDSFRDQDQNPIGPLRVWLKNEDIPGLAMTRSFGDEVASRVGVTCEPGKPAVLNPCRDPWAGPRQRRQVHRNCQWRRLGIPPEWRHRVNCPALLWNQKCREGGRSRGAGKLPALEERGGRHRGRYYLHYRFLGCQADPSGPFAHSALDGAASCQQRSCVTAKSKAWQCQSFRF